MTKLSKKPTVGVIGMGIIGQRVASLLDKAGYTVTVWSRTPKPLPRFVGSAAEVAQVSDIIQIFVNRSEDLLEIMAALSDQLSGSKTVIAHATVSAEAMREAASLAQARGAVFIEAPFTGSRQAAAAGQLVYYTGGKTDDLDAVRPVLDVSSKEVLPIGDIGEASLIKIATNMITATTVEVLAEAYALTGANGIDPEKLQSAIESNACASGVTALKLPGIIHGDYSPHFSLKNMFKDAQYALDAASAIDLEMPAMKATASELFDALEEGAGEEDFSVIARRFQEGEEF